MSTGKSFVTALNTSYCLIHLFSLPDDYVAEYKWPGRPIERVPLLPRFQVPGARLKAQANLKEPGPRCLNIHAHTDSSILVEVAHTKIRGTIRANQVTSAASLPMRHSLCSILAIYAMCCLSYQGKKTPHWFDSKLFSPVQNYRNSNCHPRKNS